MKIFILLCFSSFLYAQNNPGDSAPQNNPQPAPQQEEPDTQQKKQNPPSESQKPDSTQPPENPPVKNQEPDSAKQIKEAKQKPHSNTQQQNQSSADKPAVQQAVTVPQQPPRPAPPEEQAIPYYNPLHPQSPSTYQEGDLPSASFSEAATRKKRKHRLSISGKLLDFRVQGSLKKMNSNISADYGYSLKYFEIGPYASFELNDFDLELRQFQDELMFSAGAFFEVNFMDQAKNAPAIGLKTGYKRKENVNYIVGQLYVTMKFFLNHQTALFASLAPYYQYKLNGQKGEWGVEIPTGLRFYFY